VKTKTIARMPTVSGFRAFIWNSHVFAVGGVHYQEVGGAILTDFFRLPIVRNRFKVFTPKGPPPVI
jgi:hypothetical protein